MYPILTQFVDTSRHLTAVPSPPPNQSSTANLTAPQAVNSTVGNTTTSRNDLDNGGGANASRAGAAPAAPGPLTQAQQQRQQSPTIGPLVLGPNGEPRPLLYPAATAGASILDRQYILEASKSTNRSNIFSQLDLGASLEK